MNRRLHPSRGIIGVDLSEGMIGVGQSKVEAAGASGNIRLMVADCLDLPFDDGEMDCVTAAFGCATSPTSPRATERWPV